MLEKVMDTNEKVLWKGKPDLLIYILGNPIIYFVAIGWALFDFAFLSAFRSVPNAGTNGFLHIFFIFHLFPVWFAILLPIYRSLNYRNIEYALTDKRVYVCGGIFGRDITNMEHREITNLSVDVNFLENIKKVGTINLSYTAGGEGNLRYSFKTSQNQLISIKNPYEVYKLIKKVSLDVATDQAYPNAYRPEENRGYRTEYKK